MTDAQEREVIEAAEAIVSHWYSPKWKDKARTAACIARLRAAVNPVPPPPEGDPDA